MTYDEHPEHMVRDDMTGERLSGLRQGKARNFFHGTVTGSSSRHAATQGDSGRLDPLQHNIPSPLSCPEVFFRLFWGLQAGCQSRLSS